MAGDDRARLIQPISQREFDLYGLLLDRGPNYEPLEPVSAYKLGGGAASGSVLFDPRSQTFTALTLRRRIDHCWVVVAETPNLPTPEAALDRIGVNMRSGEPAEPLQPGIRRRAPLLKPGSRGTSPEFDLLTTTVNHLPALMAVGECYLALPNPDPNFVTDFQTNNFASRLFELYLLACFREQGLIVRQDHVSPDFWIERDGASCWVEAVTANSPVPRSGAARIGRGSLLLLARDYVSVEDGDYLDDPSVGAMMSSAAISKAPQRAYQTKTVALHVHCHGHCGPPEFSGVDVRENAKFVPNFFNVTAHMPHGALLLSRDNAAGAIWLSRDADPIAITRFTGVGAAMAHRRRSMTRHARQSFLGADSERRLANLTVGVVGLGGGGSHVVQQLAHVGVGGMVLADPDIAEDSNLNRLIGATSDDVADEAQKVAIAERQVRGLVHAPRLLPIARIWQDATEALAECDIIIGGLDSYRERSELEAFCRRLLIPCIDMGMDVHEVGSHFAIGGQVVLSSPGAPCLWCLGILTHERLELEAQDYGAAGGKPQVVWPNGVLASLAVGLTVQLATPWMSDPIETAYLEFDGNRHHVATSNRLRAIAGRECDHYRADETGDPLFDIRQQLKMVTEDKSAISADTVPLPQASPPRQLGRRLRHWLSRFF